DKAAAEAAVKTQAEALKKAKDAAEKAAKTAAAVRSSTAKKVATINANSTKAQGKLQKTVTQPNSPVNIGGILNSFNTISKTVQKNQNLQCFVSMKCPAK
ncbi:MAG: hypothetical protein ACKOCY_09135, partial [Actinomycetota bacterium]